MEKNSELYLYALELGAIPIEEYEEEEEETK
jgi:hypothetical protein